ncbi:hypothetical protein BH10ACT1_BH10ACT1_25350 [soil metagenome]
MSRHPLRSRFTKVALAGALVFAVVGVTTSPASAAPGDAAASGLRADLDVSLLDGTLNLTVNGSIGALAGPPSATADLLAVDASLGTALASVSADAVSTEVVSTAGGSSASSEVTGAQVDIPAVTALLGGILVDTGASVIRATATCPADGVPTADVEPPVSLLVAGVAVTLDVNGHAVVDLGLAGAASATVTLDVDSTTTTTTTGAAAALVLSFDIDLAGGLATVSGTVAIAEASCESPTAVAPVPTATSLTPDQGPVAGGTGVTITGSGFVAGQTSVTIGGNTVPAANVTVNSDTSLTFTTPAHTAGPVDVTVTTPGGTSTPALDFTYIAVDEAPTTAGITPDQGPTTGGTTVTITGTGFVPGQTTVTIGGTTIPAGEVTVSPDGTSLTVVTPPHAAGPVDVTVTTPGGTSEGLIFTYVDSGPDSGPGDGGSGGPTAGTGSGLTPTNRGTSGTLPRTGTDVEVLLGLGLAALASGTALLQARRLRGLRPIGTV